MIKPSFIIALFGLLVLMAIGFLLIHGDRPQVEAQLDPGKPLIVPFDVTTAQSISIKKGDVAVTMERKDKKWVMTSLKNRPVKDERISQLLGNLNMARIDSLREGADKNFALDEKGRTLLTVDRGAAKTELILGKTGEGVKSFVRKDATGPIYEVDKALDTDSGVRLEKEERVLDPSYFFDLGVLAVNAEDVMDIIIKKGHSVVRLQKVVPGKGPVEPKQELGKDDPKPVWWITEPFGGATPDESAIARIAAQMHFNARGYADTVPEKDRGLDKPAAKVKIRLKDGTEQNLTFGKVEPSEVIVAVEGRADPYRIDKYVYDAIAMDAGELIKKDNADIRLEGSNNNGAPTPPNGQAPQNPNAPPHARPRPPMPNIPPAPPEEQHPVPPAPAPSPDLPKDKAEEKK